MHEKGSVSQNVDTETVRSKTRSSIHNRDEVASKRADSRSEKGTVAASVRRPHLSGSGRCEAARLEAGAKASEKGSREEENRETILKRCPSCGEQKDISLFRKHTTGRSRHGVKSSCKACQNARSQDGRDKVKQSGVYIAVSEKQCNRCKTVKPASAFGALKTSSDRLKPRCRECDAEVSKRSYYKINIKRLYGITLETYNLMCEMQSGKCAICKSEPRTKRRKLYIDHDHKTGKVRGLLCHHCNLGLGGFRDDPDALRSAISYLQAQAV